MIEIRVDTVEQLPQRLEALGNRIRMIWDGKEPITLSFKRWVDFRSRSQNNLYWEWMTQMAAALSTDLKPLSKDDMHDLCRYKFLGTESVTIGNEQLVRLPSTTKLDRHGMYDYMTKVESWASSLGLYLLIPAENDYSKMREAQQ